MRSMLVLPLAAALVLTACSGSEDVDADGDGKISAGEAGEAASRMESPLPGLYKVTVETLEISAPGMPAAARQQMESMKGMKSEFTYCQKAEDAQQAVRDMTGNMGQGNCTYNTFKAGGSTIEVDMSCKPAAGGSVKYKMLGTLSREGMDMTSEIDTEMPGMPGGPMHMKQRMKSERTGDCPG